MAPNPMSLPCAFVLQPPSHRDATTPSPCWAPHFMTQERLMFSNPTLIGEPRLSPAATMSYDMLSALTPPLHCTSILQPATPPQVVAWHSWVLEQSFLVRGRTCSIVYKIVDNFVDDDDGFYYHTKWFSTLDWGSMRPNLLFWIWNYRWFAFTTFAFVFGKKKCFKEKAGSPRSHPAS